MAMRPHSLGKVVEIFFGRCYKKCTCKIPSIAKFFRKSRRNCAADIKKTHLFPQKLKSMRNEPHFLSPETEIKK